MRRSFASNETIVRPPNLPPPQGLSPTMKDGSVRRLDRSETERNLPFEASGISEAEARVVGEEVEALHTNGTSLDEIAVLVRAGFQTREFEERFITLGVPYRVVGGPRFYEREEIRDAIAYFRVVRQPDDDRF